jgi:hypothetical protein
MDRAAEDSGHRIHTRDAPHTAVSSHSASWAWRCSRRRWETPRPPRAERILIANLIIKDVYYHPIQLDPGPGAQAPRIYNVRLVDAGEQFIKSSLNAGGVNDGIVE